MQTITKIYTGRDNHCRCGCAGNYFTSEDREFPELVARFEKSWARYEKAGKVTSDDIGPNYRNISFSGNKALTAYFD
jgi:hypothetical protein